MSRRSDFTIKQQVLSWAQHLSPMSSFPSVWDRCSPSTVEFCVDGFNNTAATSDMYDDGVVILYIRHRCRLFERSEFLIDTSPKNNLHICTAKKVCTANCLGLIILVLGGSLKSYCYRYVCTTRTIDQMRMYLVSCEKHSMVVYIHEPYPWAQTVVARR